MLEELDRLDRRILFELDKNSRQSYSELARSLKQGRDRVEYRVQRMREEKIIRGFTAAVDLYRLGFTIFKTYLRLENNKARVQEFVEYLRNHPRVYWIALTDGSWDLMIAVFARHAEEFHRIHQSILSAFNEIVLHFGMYTLTDLWVYRKSYLVGRGQDHFRVGAVGEPMEIDATDYALLKLLSRDSRQSYAELADQAKVTAAVARYRIEQMEKRRLIVGYRVEIDLNRIGMLFFKTQLFLRSYDEALHTRFREWCGKNPHITYYIHQLGDCTIELEMEVLDYEDYNRIIDEIRGEFSRLIRNFQTVLVRKAYFSWVPQDLDLGPS